MLNGSIVTKAGFMKTEISFCNTKCTMLLFDELGKCPFVGKGSTGEYLVYIVLINLVELSSC